MTEQRWKDLDLDFLRSGYQFHIDEGHIRHGRGNKLQEYSDSTGNRCVRITTASGDRLTVPKALLVGMAALGAKTLARVDVDLLPEAAHKIERFQACNVPFEQCPDCGEPIPFRLKSLWPAVTTPLYLQWERDIDTELKHAANCWANLMKVPPYFKCPPSACKLHDDPTWAGPTRPRVYH